MDDDQGFYSNLSLDEDDPQKVLAGILSPADAQTLEASPPVAPAVSGPGQSTPRTGNLAVAPQQAQPRVSGPAMLPGIATKPENLVAAAQVPASAPSTLIRALPGSMAGTSSRFVRQPVASSAPTSLTSIPGYRSRTQSSPGAPVATAIAPTQPQGTPSQQRWQRVLSGGGLAGTFAAQQQAYAARPQVGPAPIMPTSLGSPSAAPSLPATASTVAPSGQQKLAQDQAALTRYQQTGSGIDQIKNPVGRDFARAGDIALSVLAPNVERITPGTMGNNERLQELKEGQIANDQQQLQQAGNLADTQSQMQYRQQQAAKDQAQAQADTTRQPTPQEAADYHLDPNAFYRPADIGRAAVQAAKNTATRDTHTGGQSRTLSATDAAAIDMPSLAGATMSNDEYQRTLQQRQRNQQSGSNNAANNANRVTTTGMRDQTAAGNSERAHGGKGAGAGAGTPKPIPAGVKDRIESQKNTAISKAKADFDSGDTDLQGYISRWQQAQDDYEDRISAQTGSSVPHTDIRSNIDAKGNWRGGNQPATAQPQAQQPAKRPDFTTRKGTAVSIGDPVNVGGRKGTISGFNPTNGKAQVKWEGQ